MRRPLLGSGSGAALAAGALALALSLVVVVVVVVALAALGSPRGSRSARRLPDGPTVVEKVREVARLETLEARVHKKVTYAPGPPPVEDVVDGLRAFVREAFAPREGTAIVFADVRMGLDLGRLDASAIRVVGHAVELSLPEAVARVDLRPGETEVVRSNLSSEETAALLEEARLLILVDARADRRLQAKAEAQARRALTSLLLSLGFTEVRFVDGRGRADGGAPRLGEPPPRV